MDRMSQINRQEKKEREKRKLERRREKLRKKRWKRINARIERGIAFLAVVIFGVSVWVEIDEIRKGKDNG